MGFYNSVESNQQELYSERYMELKGIWQKIERGVLLTGAGLGLFASLKLSQGQREPTAVEPTHPAPTMPSVKPKIEPTAYTVPSNKRAEAYQTFEGKPIQLDSPYSVKVEGKPMMLTFHDAGVYPPDPSLDNDAYTIYWVREGNRDNNMQTADQQELNTLYITDPDGAVVEFAQADDKGNIRFH
ncbi:hypothetical protein C5B42_05500 [Candidatus Cerribacteria bacterium 'Amazon FNV 2010 28 9']|uniref:Uncharacterized protein n=1 Tax=Candidatus Cerribacteria bacterium 'Amazon FNV 2010 28 9' TaxID=2081795 RepID=A0A317JSB0_9BACT|nr:MAG: hypothetical protein C5B42_05500 [Candidatus Cerribacteria bacterium 'Amazon FNV 2010 28 9']